MTSLPLTRPKICVLLTGGTICMSPTVSGLAPVKGYLLNRMKRDPDFQNEAVPLYDVFEWENPVDSSVMNQRDWIHVARDIEERYYDYSGFVVCHGTDTMAYTAAALSFMLENLAKPVIVTGSQIPISFVFSDAKQNLIGSMIVAGAADISEVCVLFNGKVFRGNRVTKNDTDSMDAFISPNFPLLGKLNTSLRIESSLIRPPPMGRFRVAEKMLASNILIFSVTPGFNLHLSSTQQTAEKLKSKTGGKSQVAGIGTVTKSAQPLSAFGLICDALIAKMRAPETVDSNGTVLVLKLFGLGHCATDDAFTGKLKALKDCGVEVVLMSQCTNGYVDPYKYGAGAGLRNLDLIHSLDMTKEATVAKLAYLLGKGLRGAQLFKWMHANLRGELVTESVISQKMVPTNSATAGYSMGNGLNTGPSDPLFRDYKRWEKKSKL